MVQILRSHLDERHSLRLEWAIVALIAIEVISNYLLKNCIIKPSHKITSSTYVIELRHILRHSITSNKSVIKLSNPFVPCTASQSGGEIWQAVLTDIWQLSDYILSAKSTKAFIFCDPSTNYLPFSLQFHFIAVVSW